MNDSRLDAGLRPGISTFPMKHQILTIRLSLQSVFRFCRQIYTQPTYSHQQLCAVMVHPDQRQVLPMAIAAVRNGDGSTKNDCERGAWPRLVPVLASLYRRMKLIVIADGLFSQGPQIRLLQEHGLRFLLAARAGDHPHLQAQLDRSDAPWFADPSPEGQERDRQLRVVPEVELNAANPDLKVQVLQSSERRGSGEDARRTFTWVTDLPLNPHNASELARAARSRWKIENETFNTLKNVQYLEHNFGHGKPSTCRILSLR